MLRDNTYHAEDEAALPPIGTSRDAMNVRLNEVDRQTVDMLLSGEPANDGLDASMLERVHSVRRILSVLEAMPADEPRIDLTQAVLQKLTPQAIPTENHPSAGL